MINSVRKVETFYIYFKEALLDDQNRFTLNFSNEIIVNEILFFPDKDYYISSMNCDLKLLKDFQAREDILDDIKKLSILGHLLLEKGPNYQNDVGSVYLYLGAPGLVYSGVTYNIVLIPAQIKLYSYNFKF